MKIEFGAKYGRIYRAFEANVELPLDRERLRKDFELVLDFIEHDLKKEHHERST
jgi:hypothetical protein